MTNIDEVVEEAMIRIKKNLHYRRDDLLDKHIENVFSTSINQAIAEERERVREMIDRHDPNVKMERETNPAYWGNTLRAELDELIKSDN